MKKFIETLKSILAPAYEDNMVSVIPPLSKDLEEYERQLELSLWQSGYPYF